MKRALSTLFCLLALSCNDGTKTGNSGTKTGNSDQVDILMRAVNAPEVAAAARGAAADPLLTEDAQGSLFEIQMVMLSLRDVKLFFSESTCTDFLFAGLEPPVVCNGNHVSVDGPMLIDLISGDSIPSLNDLTVPVTDYVIAIMNLEAGDPDDGIVMMGEPLDGASFYIEGAFTCADGFSECTGDHAFSGAFDFNNQIIFLGEPFTVDMDSQSLQLNLEVSAWFDALEITQCIQDGDLAFELDGSLVLQDGGNSCNNLENTIRNSLATSAKFGGVAGE